MSKADQKQVADNAPAQQPRELRQDQAQQEQRGGAQRSREDRVREAAYAAAERRGFAPGREVDDWLEAEQQVGDGATGGARQGS